MARSPNIVPLERPAAPIKIGELLEAANRVPPGEIRREICRHAHLLEAGESDRVLTLADLRHVFTIYALSHKLLYGISRIPMDANFLL